MEEKKVEFEFFDNMLPIWNLDTLKRKNEPSAVNQSVAVKRYRLKVELIEEPKEVLVQRCKELYKKEDNWHNKESINNFVKKLIGKRMYDILNEERENPKLKQNPTNNEK